MSLALKGLTTNEKYNENIGPSFGPPSERLPICGRTVEEQIASLHRDVFLPAGLEIIRFTKLPYLCEGDLHNDFFVLIDIVFVLKKTEVKETTGDSELHCRINTSV